MMPQDLPNDQEQARMDLETEDVTDEYEPDDYYEGHEITGDERAISDSES